MKDNKTKNAKEKSIKEFDNLMGIDLAMEDSKIRGVGEILGEKQHGTVETLVIACIWKCWQKKYPK